MLKNGVFYPILTQKPGFSSNSPYIRGKNDRKKLSKTLIPHQRFSRFFGQNPSIWDPSRPQNHENSWKSTISAGRPPPPKIIKNRLNFARSHIREKSLKNGVFIHINRPPPKIIKNRLNFALSKKFIKRPIFTIILLKLPPCDPQSAF